MGMSTHVVGFVPPDEEWEKKKAVWNACKEAGIKLPSEVESYFDCNDPNGLPGLEVSIGEALEWFSEEWRQGYDVRLDKLPPNIKVLRFFNSW